ncbi:putative immunoglobulin-blocking virulence protein [Mycoplasmopsis felis]|uniref:putative immunoglobulin-blocking virulence protein n=1 Tax=Mycoplasmopsis felis TaxID=33923 RepID=UPI00056148E5|nr:putative immunoglobulin-blocking virulence protein [Mycoplasmopsis felis]
MNLFKKRKIRMLTIVLGSTVVIASISGTLLQKTLGEINSKNFVIDDSLKAELINKDNLDLNKAREFNTDIGLKEIPKPKPILVDEPKREPKPEPPIIILEPEPVPQPEPEPIPQPDPIPEPQPIQPPKQSGNELTILIRGVRVKASITKGRPRTVFDYDVANNIANNEPYTAELTGKLNSIEVTDELRRKVVSDTAQEFVFKRSNPNDTFGLATSVLQHYNNDLNQLESFLRQQPDNWTNYVYKFSRLINSDNVVNFLKEDAKPMYPEIKNHPNKTYREYWLINNLDFSLFTKLSSAAENFLKKGETLDPRNAYITENGEWESHSYSPPDEFNTVTTLRIRDNQHKRAFGYDTWYGRSPSNIKEGRYDGWTKTNVKNQEKFNKFNIQDIRGIQIFELTRDTEIPNDFNRGYVVELDSADPKAYQRTKTLIEDFKKEGIEISSYRIFNMGKTSSNQKFLEILSVLPNELRQLELFFDASAANTSALIALENKKIKELSLYTEGNSLLEYWSLNPLALRNTNWVNTIDYNVSKENPANTNIPTRITFNALAFEDSDYLKGEEDPYKRINDGLRLAYFSRNNEGIFQGNHGPGLSPDHNEGDNSYPTALDLSRAPSLRSLKGLKFFDMFKPSNKSRKLKTLWLYNNSENFDIDVSELNSAGFENMAIGEPGPPKTKIEFSNKESTRYLYIKGVGTLFGSGLTNLTLLMDLSQSLDKTTIKVDPGATELKQQLRSQGYTVVDYSEDDFVIT